MTEHVSNQNMRELLMPDLRDRLRESFATVFEEGSAEISLGSDDLRQLKEAMGLFGDGVVLDPKVLMENTLRNFFVTADLSQVLSVDVNRENEAGKVMFQLKRESVADRTASSLVTFEDIKRFVDASELEFKKILADVALRKLEFDIETGRDTREVARIKALFGAYIGSQVLAGLVEVIDGDLPFAVTIVPGSENSNGQ